MARINGIYADALKQAVKEQAAFLKKIKDIDEGRIKPPQYYVDRGQVDKWRQGFTRELLRKQQVIEGIIKRLNAAGIEAGDVILKSMKEIWRVNREETAKLLQSEAKKAGINVNFAQYDAHQIDVLMQENQSPFSKIAYKNLGQNPAVRRRLQNELSQATILGESQQKIIKRIRAVTGQAQWQARRVAQTERTRVQSQARWMTGQEAAEMGINVANRWSTRMVNSRDTHIALNGKWAKQGERFPGSILRFPGDPEASAGEVINCHCRLSPHVLLEGERIDENGNLVESVLQSSRENDIMNTQGRDAMSVAAPIQQRNTGKGNPNAILQAGRPLNRRQASLLAQLPDFDSSIEVKKKGVNVKDLAALTAETGDEFALFTRKGKRLIIRGNPSQVAVDIERAKALAAAGYRWSCHTHPGIDGNALFASEGDIAVLAVFHQTQSCIVNSKGQYSSFGKE